MKFRKKNKLRSAVKFLISSAVLAVAVAGISVAAFAEGENETTQTVYIGGNTVVVSATKGSYWYYNEADGTISESDEDNANIIINDEKEYQEEKDDGDMYMSIKNVNITSNGQNYYYFSNSGIYSIADELFLRVYGDCKISGAEYGIYANRIHLSGQDEQAKLTITGDNTLAKPGTYFPKSEGIHVKKLSRIVAGVTSRNDFSVIIRSNTNNTVYGSFTLFGSKNSIFAGADIDGADAKEFFADEDGYYQLGDKSQYKYIEYRVGTELYDKVEITDATLNFNAGDKPCFTAKLADKYEDKFSIWEEEWALLDENGNRVKWCSSVEVFNPTNEENLLTEFEEGKTYYYSLTVSIKNFSCRYADNVAVVVNGKTYNFDNSNHSYYYTLSMYNFIEMTPTVKIDTVIDKVEITGATLAYNDGDKPVATAVTSGKYKDNYEIAYEYWEEMKQNADGTLEPVAFWYSDDSMYTSATKKFTQFESGKKYMYSIGLKAKDGYKFADSGLLSMTFNGKEVAAVSLIPSSDGKTAMALALKTINISQTVQHSHSYDKWSYDKDSHWLQCTDADCDDLNGSIKDKAEHTFESDKDTVCLVCGYERQIEKPDEPVKPGDSDNKPDEPVKPDDSGDKPDEPGNDKPIAPGESEDVTPGQCSGNPVINPVTGGSVDMIAIALSAVLLTGAIILRKKR